MYTTAASPGDRFGRRLDGCLAETRSTRDFAAVPNLSSLPPRVDLRPGCSPVEDQGHVGSCTANAVVGAVEFKRRKAGRQEDLSRLFVYYNARRLRGAEGEDAGATIGHGMAALLAHGVPPERAWPYDPEKVTVTPDDSAYGLATAESEIEYARVDGIEHIKGALAREFPVVFAISLPTRCYDEASRTGLMPDPSDDELAGVLTRHGRHAMLLVGYDSNDRFFRIRNSWGAGWGEQGYCRVSMETFERGLAVNSAWILGSLEKSGAFSVMRPAPAASARPPVEGGVRDRGAQFRDEIRGGITTDIGDAIKDIRQRVNPPRRDG